MSVTKFLRSGRYEDGGNGVIQLQKFLHVG